ncbi:LiaF domain-containing protein [Idiomarina xiamenensis]|uniref:Cell wall-active antibiotics response LiaF-like C-terminal domain-containing protein n=1 Tax=Idiomarina xiamenensis 10-D-4 TaxID=740709 RepID=K2KMC5_9GAMM|nr:LiaF domain-containing protein [Idiomarina xiamenensis]EKE87677.1 hypothetical protein A10D4_01255 [Idiomarina xiamenensis 10-D-4]
MAIHNDGVTITDRPIEQVREQAIDQLIMSYGHGVISAEAFERRLDEATNTDSHQRLVELVADLSLEPDNAYQQQRQQSFMPRYQSAGTARHERITSILSSSHRNGQWLVPEELSVLAVLGSVTLDFSDATFTTQQVTINIANWVSDVTLYVPEHVNVVLQMTDILASTDNTAPSMGGRQGPTLVVTGHAALASLSVEVKCTMKEKFVAFANQVRQSLKS